MSREEPPQMQGPWAGELPASHPAGWPLLPNPRGWAVGSTAGGTSSPGSGPGPRPVQLRPPTALYTVLSEGAPGPLPSAGPGGQGLLTLPQT